jgi:hypothetical protein
VGAADDTIRRPLPVYVEALWVQLLNILAVFIFDKYF